MVKKIFYSVFIFIFVLYMTGCGKIENGSLVDNNSIKKVETSSDKQVSSNNEDTSKKVSSEAVETPYTTETSKTPEIIKEKFSVEQPYSNVRHSIKILGLKEYNELKEEKYTDKPSKGKKYLVVFLSIQNNSLDEDYINANYIHGKVDNKKIEHTFLVNSPRNYSTVFKHIPSGQNIEGFIVWEVPKNWKKLVFYYDGWQYTDNISLECTLKKKDLFNPPIYNKTN